MKPLVLFLVLLLAVPMIALNPFGRGAFVGYYLGVVATWLAYVVALRRGAAIGQTSR